MKIEQIIECLNSTKEQKIGTLNSLNKATFSQKAALKQALINEVKKELKIDISKPLKFKEPLEGEENIEFEIINFNLNSKRVIVRQLNIENLAPTFTYSVNDLMNI